jgi:antitoxin (DNA-binding transcriptional repressor) of toxin-antitoxin stability system
MKIIEVTDATQPLAEYAAGVPMDPVLLTVGGNPVAALVPVENADLETAALSMNSEFMALIERSRESCRAGRTVSALEVRRLFADDERQA